MACQGDIDFTSHTYCGFNIFTELNLLQINYLIKVVTDYGKVKKYSSIVASQYMV